MTKQIAIILLMAIIIASCSDSMPTKKIQFPGLKERRVQVTKTFKFEGFIIGSNFDRNEVYIQTLSKLKQKYGILVVEIGSGKILKEIQLSKGAHQSPTDFFNPTFMDFCGGNYLIIDQYDKILVYDEQLNYLYTNMFRMPRYFIDFYVKDNECYFLIGAKQYGMKFNRNNINLFQLLENKRPVHVKGLHVFNYMSLGQKQRENRKFFYTGSLWPSGKGFEKDKKVYYANYDEKKYYVYDLKENSTSIFGLKYLTGKDYSNETASKIVFYNSDGWQDRIFKQSGRRVVVLAYPNPLYHFGIFDVGKNKIGIIGDLDTEHLRFRLDILDAIAGEYLESIWLPLGDGLIQNITESARGMTPTYINIDKGYYLWNNAEGDDFIDYGRITAFDIKREK